MNKSTVVKFDCLIWSAESPSLDIRPQVLENRAIQTGRKDSSVVRTEIAAGYDVRVAILCIFNLWRLRRTALARRRNDLADFCVEGFSAGSKCVNRITTRLWVSALKFELIFKIISRSTSLLMRSTNHERFTPMMPLKLEKKTWVLCSPASGMNVSWSRDFLRYCTVTLKCTSLCRSSGLLYRTYTAPSQRIRNNIKVL